MRIWTGSAGQLGSCDHCVFTDAPSLSEAEEEGGMDQVITVVTLHRGGEIVFLARFCQKHFLQFSDLVSDQVAALLYPAQKTH